MRNQFRASQASDNQKFAVASNLKCRAGASGRFFFPIHDGLMPCMPYVTVASTKGKIRLYGRQDGRCRSETSRGQGKGNE